MRGRRYGYFARKERRKARRRLLGRWRVLRNNDAFNPHLRQLLHVGYKIAAKLGDRCLEALQTHADSISRNVTANLYDRHLKPLFLKNG